MGTLNKEKAEAAALNIAKSYQEKMVTVPVCQVGGTSGLVVMRDAVLEGIDFGRAQAIVEREMAEAKTRSVGGEYVLVPREATERMAFAGESAASYGIGKPNDDEAIRRVWRDMVAVAPSVSEAEQNAIIEAQTGSMRHDVEEGGVIVTCGKCHGIGCDFCDGFGHFNKRARKEADHG